MSEPASESSDRAPSFLKDRATRRWLASAGILAIGIVIGGYLLGNGLVRAKEADRSVTVRGLAERDVTADLATWTVAYSATALDLASAQASVDRDSNEIRAFFHELGFPADDLAPTGVNVSQFTDNGVPKFTVRPSHPAPAGYEDAPPPTAGMEGGPSALAGTKRRGQYLGGPEGGAAAPPQRPTRPTPGMSTSTMATPTPTTRPTAGPTSTAPPAKRQGGGCRRCARRWLRSH